jgi:hypothetical protein
LTDKSVDCHVIDKIEGDSMLLRKGMAVASLCAVAMAGTIALAPGAMADTYTMHTDDTDPGGRVKFNPNGDVVEICDIEADGHAVFLDVNNYTKGTNEYTYQIGGDGRCQTLRASLGQPWDMAEGDVFRFQICLVRDSVRNYCDTANWANVN